MTSYTEEALVQKLARLVETQDSITVLSQWLMYHRKHAGASVQTWARELHKAPSHRKLSFLYLANDVVQNSRRKGEEFVREFAKVFPETVPHVYRHTAPEIQQKITRILGILEERKIYGPDFIKVIKDRLVSRPPAATFASEDAMVIGTHLENIRKNEAARQKLAERVHEIPEQWPSAADGNNPEVAAAIEQLERYQRALKSDISERNQLIENLNKLIQKQELHIQGDELELEQCQHKINTIRAEPTASTHPLQDQEEGVQIGLNDIQVDHAHALPHQDDITSDPIQAVIPDSEGLPSDILQQLQVMAKAHQEATGAPIDSVIDPTTGGTTDAMMNDPPIADGVITHDIVTTLEFLRRQGGLSTKS
ncbi:uncharacterized protein SPPG_09088 [Spizellomyces punctatus DAOM BR117]|uniref:CID domain-containing protein n=1 Tax=Spizellomyces punctatus (strain DAOM BR117) TaxID=645134 RepID=A0A0L0HKA1_SPIPD|nr:uncharacterized protein SPPG_09088 [Spizellomyces punctatus DAOM BR117]KND01320.1 hypothetical protein SPPG_09088 [Spizellomyces punctatus DAOM BR117]|eukprot:XP_016609359.1 hypothetical protein SPPG_09088 [Spizellomyces punctatus DAOM BR117]